MSQPDFTPLKDAPALTAPVGGVGDDLKIGPLERAQGRVGLSVRGKWRLDVLLGAGGTAAVYAATHRNRSHAAIKMLHPELSAQPSVRGCFLREGYAANGVAHEGVVRVLDDDIAEDGAVFLVMELLEGHTLKDKLDASRGPLAMDEACRIADRVLDVLASAHAQGIQHRDVTPKNVFLTRDGNVKVIDFGSAFIAELSAQSGATLTGVPMGTPPYMSPELARGRFADVDPRTDVYACGAILFAMLTGKAPRKADTVNEELLAAMTEPLPSIRSIRPELPKCIVEIVDRALAFEKSERWPGARAMQDALLLAREELSSAPAPASEVTGVESSPPAMPDENAWTLDPTQQAIAAYSDGAAAAVLAMAAAAAEPSASVIVAQSAPSMRAAEPSNSGFSPSMGAGHDTLSSGSAPLLPVGLPVPSSALSSDPSLAAAIPSVLAEVVDSDENMVETSAPLSAPYGLQAVTERHPSSPLSHQMPHTPYEMVHRPLVSTIPPGGMNPLFAGADGPMPPVARGSSRPYGGVKTQARASTNIAAVLTVALLVFGAIATTALLVVDRSVLMGRANAAPLATTAAAAAPPPVAADPIPPPIAPDPTVVAVPVVTDPAPIPSPALVPAAPLAATKPVSAAATTTTAAPQQGAPAATPTTTAAVASSPAPKASSRPAKRPQPASDPLVRTNPFDR